MRQYAILIIYLTFSLVLFAKENEIEQKSEELPSSFHEISLGMSMEDVKENLKNDSSFIYRGDRDVSILTNQNRSLIESEGVHFLKRGFFQFYNERLYTIIIQMNPENMDYYSLYSSLVDKYGDPSLVDQKKALWENDRVRLVLERPLTVKYIDTAVFNEILASRTKKKALSDEVRERFINAF